MPSSTTSSDLARVLLVDDNEEMQARCAAVLTPACEIVAAVQDGPSALDAAINLQPDVIVLDISMPGMTGLEVASRLRRTGSRAAVVFLTVHDEDEVILAAQAAGGLGYVLKRRLASDLMHAVEEAVAGRPFVSSTH
jgi:DNA-binding NarL/FixJ family response regulator